MRILPLQSVVILSLQDTIYKALSLIHSKHSINVNAVHSRMDDGNNNVGSIGQVMWYFHLRRKSNYRLEKHYIYNIV